MEQIDQLFTDILPTISLPARINILLNSSNNRTDYCSYSMESRTMKDILRNKLYYRAGWYTTLFQLCESQTHIKPYIEPWYHARDTEYNNIQELLSKIREKSASGKIHIYYIPKGKTILQTLLDNADTTLLENYRLRQLENVCIQGINHFIRIYKGMFGHENETLILTSEFNESLLNTLIVFLPHLQGLTNIENPSTALRCILNIFTALFDNIANNNAQEVKTKIQNALNEWNNSPDWINASLNTFADTIVNKNKINLINNIENNISSLDSNINNYERHLAEAYQQKQEYLIQKQALESAPHQDPKLFIDILNNMQAIQVVSATANELQLSITAPLLYFNEDNFKRQEEKQDSDYSRYLANKPALKKLLHETFYTRKYQLIVQNMIKINVGSQLRISAIQDNQQSLSEIPNPHLYYYNCWNEALNAIQKYLSIQDYTLALTQIIAAVQTINVIEGATFVNKLVCALANQDRWYITHAHFINTQTNQTLSLQQALNEMESDTPIITQAQTIQEKKTEIHNAATVTFTAPAGTEERLTVDGHEYVQYVIDDPEE